MKGQDIKMVVERRTMIIHDGKHLLVVSALVLLLGAVSFSCCLAAEFKKAKAKDIEMDGSLCFVPRRSAFGLGIAAFVFLFVAQIVGTTAAATRLFCSSTTRKSSSAAAAGCRTQTTLSITLLVLSWVSFGLAAILLGTGSSMNDRQPYGRGWLDGECYVVKNGVFAGAALLAIVTAALVLGLIFLTSTPHRRTVGPYDQEIRRVVEEEEEEEHK